MKYDRPQSIVVMVLIAIVGGLAGAVITGLIVGVESEAGAGVVQIGVPLLLVSVVLLVLSSLLIARAKQRRNEDSEH